MTRRHGFWITTPERTVIDTWPQLRGRARARLLRDAVRLGLTTTTALTDVLSRHGGRRGTASLRETCAVYERLLLHRCRSDAEVEGLVVLDAVRVTPPQVNERRAGEEADFSWEDRRLIVEIDGPRFTRTSVRPRLPRTRSPAPPRGPPSSDAMLHHRARGHRP